MIRSCVARALSRTAPLLGAAFLCLCGADALLARTPDTMGGGRGKDGVLSVLGWTDRVMLGGRISRTYRTVESPFTPRQRSTPLPATGSRDAGEEMAFVDYLIGGGMASEAALWMSSADFRDSDTLRYLRGWADYNARRLSEAAEELSLVPPASAYYDKSLFFNVASNAHLGRLERCEELLDSYGGPYAELRSLQQAGVALLTDRPEAYLAASSAFGYSSHALKESEETLDKIWSDRYSARRAKSPALAAALSAAVPGLGKVYAGQTGPGINTMLVVGALAAVTAENWSRHGVSDWRTLLAGGVCAAFHIGNICGSYMSVSIHNDNIRNAQDTAILYHIHIPLRSVFD